MSEFTEQVLSTINRGGFWTICRRVGATPFTFKSYLYRGKMYLKFVRGEQLDHLGYMDRDGTLHLNKKFYSTRRTEIIDLKRFMHLMTLGISPEEYTFDTIEESALRDMTMTLEEHKEDKDYLYRIGLS